MSSHECPVGLKRFVADVIILITLVIFAYFFVQVLFRNLRYSSPKYIEQRPDTDDYPEEQTLCEGLEAYGAEHVGGERSADEEHRQREALAGEARDGLPKGGHGIEYVSVEYDGYDEVEDKPRDGDLASVALEDERGGERQRDYPQGTGELDGSGYL